MSNAASGTLSSIWNGGEGRGEEEQNSKRSKSNAGSA